MRVWKHVPRTTSSCNETSNKIVSFVITAGTSVHGGLVWLRVLAVASTGPPLGRMQAGMVEEILVARWTMGSPFPVSCWLELTNTCRSWNRTNTSILGDLARRNGLEAVVDRIQRDITLECLNEYEERDESCQVRDHVRGKKYMCWKIPEIALYVVTLDGRGVDRLLLRRKIRHLKQELREQTGVPEHEQQLEDGSITPRGRWSYTIILGFAHIPPAGA